MRSLTGFRAIAVLGALMVLAAMVGVKPPMLADSEVDASPPTDPSPAPFSLATVNPADGTMVGVAKPIIVNFAAPITDSLAASGKVDAARTTIAHSGIGVAIRKGAPKPDISTTEAFKRTLLDAKSVGFTAAGATGAYLKTLFEKLGIADEIKPKLKLLPGAVGEAAASGEIEIGMTQISEILPYTGVELAGPLPPDIQSYTYFSAAASPASKEADVARAFIKFLATPSALAVIKAKGMEPG